MKIPGDVLYDIATMGVHLGLGFLIGYMMGSAA